MLKEFKAFAMRGNVVDVAVGLVIGAAFGKIISSLVKDIIMPPIGLLLGNADFSQLNIILQEGSDKIKPVTINYGIFLNFIIDFILISFVIFLIIKQINKLKNKQPTKITSKTCDACKSSIHIEATRCSFCTSQVG